MKVLYYDCFVGISGDMNLAALIDLGADPEILKTELKKLKIDDEFKLEVKKEVKNGITGTKVNVVLKEEDNHHHHHHEDGHSHHRHYGYIKSMILESQLSEFVKKRSIETFELIATAEAKIHGTTIDKVHFHEVGATDSIVDIVGNAICIEQLKPDVVISSPVQLGGGFVKCAHGVFPVPAPATAEILKDIPVKTGLADFETTTPTGAAVIVSNANEFKEKLDFKIQKIGYGIGTKEFEVPNVLRVVLGQMSELKKVTQCFICETNIDDMNPEMYSYITESLFTIGADDVYISSIMMKKNRPANILNVICKEKVLDGIIDFILKETTSFGLRYYPVNKIELERNFKSISIEGVDIKIKYAYINGEILKYKAEYEDCVKLAKKKRISLNKVYSIVEQHINNIK